MANVKYTAEDKQRALVVLKDMLVPGTAIHSVLRKRTASGNRYYDFYYAVDKGEIRRITYHVGVLTGYTYNRKEALLFKGTGYSAAAEAIEALGRELYKDEKRFPLGSCDEDNKDSF